MNDGGRVAVFGFFGFVGAWIGCPQRAALRGVLGVLGVGQSVTQNVNGGGGVVVDVQAEFVQRVLHFIGQRRVGRRVGAP